MGLFDKSHKRRDEYEHIYDNGDDSGIDYSEPDENEDPEDAIDSIRGTIQSSDCPLCGGTQTMRYDTICFICSACGESMHEDLVYRYVAGYPIDTDDDYDDFYDDDD